MAVSGTGLALATGGGILLWSGLTGVTPLDLTRRLSTGQPAPPITVGSLSTLMGQLFSQLGSAMGSALGDAAGSAASGAAGGLLGPLGGLLASNPGGAPAGSAGSLNARIAAAASHYQGVPYRWGGSTPAGWDCSGFVTYVLHHDVGLNLPDNGHTVSQSFLTWSGATSIPKEQCQAGDLVCWITHIAIATGPDTCIGAENQRLGTVTGPIKSMGPGGETYVIRRVKDQGQAV